MNRYILAKKMKIANGHFSDILNGVKEAGRSTCEKFAQACPGYHWTDFAKMTGPEIENTLKSHLAAAREGDGGPSIDSRPGRDPMEEDRRAADRRAGLDRQRTALAARGQ